MGNRCRCGRGHRCACGHSTVQVINPPNLIEGLYEWAIKEGLFEGTMREFINFMKGPNGYTPILTAGVATQLPEGSNPTVEVVPTGQSSEGVPIYVINIGIPKYVT